MRHPIPRTVLLFTLFAIALPGCSQEPQGEKSPVADQQSASAQDALAETGAAPPSATDCQLTMGWDPWEPYQYRDVKGEVAGLDVEIALAAAAAAGCELQFVNGDWMEMLNRLRDGDVDVLAGATPTPGREEFAVFTEPYRAESFVVFTLADNADVRAAPTLAALFASDARIGTVAEYYYGEQVYELMARAMTDGRLSEAPVSEANYQRLLNGEIDAFLEDPFVASSILHDRGWQDRIVATDLGTATGSVAFMLSRQSMTPDVIQRFRHGLQAIRNNGRLDAILSEYRE